MPTADAEIDTPPPPSANTTLRGPSDAGEPRDWSVRPLHEVAHFITETHHAYTRTAIARIAPLARQVTGEHGQQHPELARVERTFAALAGDLVPHMAREDRVLFPYIRALAIADSAPAAPFGTVRNPIRMMMREHDVAADLLEQLRALTSGFVAPPDACGSYRALYAALAELRADLMSHVALENGILFPRAAALEDQRRGLQRR